MNRLAAFIIAILLSTTFTGFAENSRKSDPKIYIAFQWHMHQPIYMPYENVVQTQASNAFSFSLFDVFLSRTGPYTNWPKNAVQKGIDANYPHFGAQVSFSGSLVENLNNLEFAGVGFSNWKSSWNYITSQKTSLNNPRIDLVGFGYHHPLMGLIDNEDVRKSIQSHKAIFQSNFTNYSYSKGIFPPENAFSVRMIPALVQEGFEWVFIDNFHFERASEGCPVGDGTGVLRPNKADIQNSNPNDWVSLNGLWCPSPVSARWAHQPHYVQHVNPETGEVSKIIAVPTSRYMGNEDGRGGFGALNYDYVMSQLESYNTDPNHPILIVLHHDGDNYGGGTDSYYGSNFQNFVSWLGENSDRFVCITVQDYLELFPPDSDDVIHVQDGSWVGADSGDPQFRKWNGDPGSYLGTSNYSPDRNSWGIVTAAKNIVKTAQQVNPSSSYTTNAWKYYLNSQTSCYWYWDGTEMWDSHPARACNLAVTQAQNVLSGGYTDQTAPSVYIPQRYPYNPGEVEWSSVGTMPSDFTVWTYVFDISGLESVELKYRISDNPTVSQPNMIYSQTAGVGEWQLLEMVGKTIPSITNPQPLYKAVEYSAEITGLKEVLVDYYVEAIDTHGNIARSPIQHVWVGDGSGSNPGDQSVSWTPQEPTLNDIITIVVNNDNSMSEQSFLHWGVNGWQQPIAAYCPEGSVLFNGTGPAIQTPFTGSAGTYTLNLGPFNNSSQGVTSLDFVIYYGGSSWNNNGGADWHIPITNQETGANTNVHSRPALQVNPNPVVEYATVQIPETENGNYIVSLISLTGSTLASFQAISGEKVLFNRNRLPSGIYIFMARNIDSGEMYSTRIQISGK